jgi:hypothetical protein
MKENNVYSAIWINKINITILFYIIDFITTAKITTYLTWQTTAIIECFIYVLIIDV